MTPLPSKMHTHEFITIYDDMTIYTNLHRDTLLIPSYTQYTHGSALFDVTEGCNTGCGGNAFCAQQGWDPVTGLGVLVVC